MKSIPIKTAQRIPEQVSATCKKLRQAGFVAWLAGGCVRDMLLGRPPRDWDIVSNAGLEDLKKLFPEHLDVGVAFGILKLPGTNIDLGFFRKEGEYSDSRHPDEVSVGDEKTDSARRDFTVNALYFDPEKQEVIDHVDGHKDLGAKIIRCVGDPQARFAEDALRILRAARFSAQLGFKIEKATALALKKSASQLKKISRERVREETVRLLESQKPILGLETLAQYGMWEPVFGVRRVSVPADLRHLKLLWQPKFEHWICSLAITGLVGDPLTGWEEIDSRLTEELRLSRDERKLLKLSLSLFGDAELSVEKKYAKMKTSAEVWIDLSRESRQFVEMLKSFVRRARGPSEAQKDNAIKFLEQALRWGAQPALVKKWPNAEVLMKEEKLKEGPELGKALKLRHWDLFWSKPNIPGAQKLPPKSIA